MVPAFRPDHSASSDLAAGSMCFDEEAWTVCRQVVRASSELR